MAINDAIRGLVITITHDTQALAEYKDDAVAEENRTTTRYIEAKSGQTFAVKLELKKGTRFKGECLYVKIEIDGKWVNSALLSKDSCRNEGFAYFRNGCRTEDGLMRRFQFTSIETIDDDRAFAGELAKLKALGSIVVSVTQKDYGPPIEPTYATEATVANEVLSEKALKGNAVSHGMVFGKPIDDGQKEPQWWSTKHVKGAREPAARFVFHYRSMDALKAMLIVRPPPPPTPLLERDIETLNAAELVEYQRQCRALVKGAEAVAIKRERTDENPRPRKIARPGLSNTQLELDGDGSFRETSVSTTQAEPEVIELD